MSGSNNSQLLSTTKVPYLNNTEAPYFQKTTTTTYINHNETIQTTSQPFVNSTASPATTQSIYANYGEVFNTTVSPSVTTKEAKKNESLDRTTTASPYELTNFSTAAPTNYTNIVQQNQGYNNQSTSNYNQGYRESLLYGHYKQQKIQVAIDQSSQLAPSSSDTNNAAQSIPILSTAASNVNPQSSQTLAAASSSNIQQVSYQQTYPSGPQKGNNTSSFPSPAPVVGNFPSPAPAVAKFSFTSSNLEW